MNPLARSHIGRDDAPGALLVHGFTGSPDTVSAAADAFVGAGYHVEVPRLPGHGTRLDDMLTTTWSDWLGAVSDAHRALTGRSESNVVFGLSMGATLALTLALDHPELAGLVLVNPATRPQPRDVRAMIAEFIAEGRTVAPGSGSDIADPDAVEIAYDGTPLVPLVSFLDDGIAPLTDRLGEVKVPLLLYTSRQDHVVDPADSDHLAASYGGDVDHRWLERSYHVAVKDYDGPAVIAGAVEFAQRVTGR